MAILAGFFAASSIAVASKNPESAITVVGVFCAPIGLNQVLRADASGQPKVVVRELPMPVGVVEWADGAMVISSFYGGVVEFLSNGAQRKLTKKLGTPADGAEAVLVADCAGTSVWRYRLGGVR